MTVTAFDPDLKELFKRVLAIINGKGGVGKTSVTANVGGMAAAAGWRVLLIDFDPQGNLGRDLGVRYTERDDDGQAMFATVTLGHPLTPLSDVRPNLDLVCGGGRIAEMSGALHRRRRGATDTVLRDALTPIAGNYHLILIDCPPGEDELQRMALTGTRHVVIPTKSDSASLDGLVRVAQLFADVKSGPNPDLELLGVLLFGVGAGATRIARAARETVGRELGSPDLVFESRIRHAEGAAVNCRDLGKLAFEVEAALPEAKASRLAALRGRRKAGGGQHRADDDGPRLASSAAGLTSDYQAFVTELITRYRARIEVHA